MSFDKQNFARSVQEQQGGISPQMWPIIFPGNSNFSLNLAYELAINPCDSLWLPTTFDKSYGTNPIQSDPTYGRYYPDPSFMGCNVWDVNQPSSNTYYPPSPVIIAGPIFSVRFNSPNNPWLLWGMNRAAAKYNGELWGASGMQVAGRTSLMRSISGPISRMWIQFYGGTNIIGRPTPPGCNQIIFMSMLGYSQTTEEHDASMVDTDKILTNPPVTYNSLIHTGGYRAPDLNTADLSALGVKAPKGT